MVILCSEIQLKSPNWLFGQRKFEDSSSALKVGPREVASEGSHSETKFNGFGDVNWLSFVENIDEEEIFQRYFHAQSILILTRGESCFLPNCYVNIFMSLVSRTINAFFLVGTVNE